MVKADLITGFLGSGKTTFIRRYVKWLLDQGEKVCILENDHGAVNVDMMLLSDLKSDRLGIEMVAGGCDYDCHRRRFKTKLITIAMLGYSRVLIEPSGLFDVDEFFDILHEDPLYSRYEIANVLTIVNADLEEDFSPDMDYMLASQISQSGRVILSHVQEVDAETIGRTADHIERALKGIRSERHFTLGDTIIAKDWDAFTDEDYRMISQSGYMESAFVKAFDMDHNAFNSLFFMNVSLSREALIENIKKIFQDPAAGHVLRIKGFVKDGLAAEADGDIDEGSLAVNEGAGDGRSTEGRVSVDDGAEYSRSTEGCASVNEGAGDGRDAECSPAVDAACRWYEINATSKAVKVGPIAEGQEIIIVIGENLDEKVIDAYLPSRWSTGHVKEWAASVVSC